MHQDYGLRAVADDPVVELRLIVRREMGHGVSGGGLDARAYGEGFSSGIRGPTAHRRYVGYRPFAQCVARAASMSVLVGHPGFGLAKLRATLFALIALLTTLGTAPAPSVSLAAPPFHGVNLDEDTRTFYSEHFAQQLGLNGLKVTTAREIQQVLGFERQKQLLGCGEDSASCLAELANALGVDGLVSGSIGKLGSVYQVNLKIISAQTAETLASFAARARSEEQVLDVLAQAAREMSARVLGRSRTGLERREPASSTGRRDLHGGSGARPGRRRSAGPTVRQWSWAPATAGVALGLGGAWFIARGNEVDGALRSQTDPLPLDEARARLEQGKSDQALGATLLSVGIAGVLAGGGMFLFGDGAPQVTFVPSSSPTLSVSGRFP